MKKGKNAARYTNDGDASEERKANIKRAWFFATVAVLFVLANQLGHVRNASDSNSGPAM